MTIPARTPPEDYPYVIDETKLLDISDSQLYLQRRALSDRAIASVGEDI